MLLADRRPAHGIHPTPGRNFARAPNSLVCSRSERQVGGDHIGGGDLVLSATARPSSPDSACPRDRVCGKRRASTSRVPLSFFLPFAPLKVLAPFTTRPMPLQLPPPVIPDERLAREALARIRQGYDELVRSAAAVVGDPEAIRPRGDHAYGRVLHFLKTHSLRRARRQRPRLGVVPGLDQWRPERDLGCAAQAVRVACGPLESCLGGSAIPSRRLRSQLRPGQVQDGGGAQRTASVLTSASASCLEQCRKPWCVRLPWELPGDDRTRRLTLPPHSPGNVSVASRGQDDQEPR